MVSSLSSQPSLTFVNMILRLLFSYLISNNHHTSVHAALLIGVGGWSRNNSNSITTPKSSSRCVPSLHEPLSFIKTTQITTSLTSTSLQSSKSSPSSSKSSSNAASTTSSIVKVPSSPFPIIVSALIDFVYSAMSLSIKMKDAIVNDSKNNSNDINNNGGTIDTAASAITGAGGFGKRNNTRKKSINDTLQRLKQDNGSKSSNSGNEDGGNNKEDKDRDDNNIIHSLGLALQSLFSGKEIKNQLSSPSKKQKQHTNDLSSIDFDSDLDQQIAQLVDLISSNVEGGEEGELEKQIALLDEKVIQLSNERERNATINATAVNNTSAVSTVDIGNADAKLSEKQEQKEQSNDNDMDTQIAQLVDLISGSVQSLSAEELEQQVALLDQKILELSDTVATTTTTTSFTDHRISSNDVRNLEVSVICDESVVNGTLFTTSQNDDNSITQIEQDIAENYVSTNHKDGSANITFTSLSDANDDETNQEIARGQFGFIENEINSNNRLDSSNNSASSAFAKDPSNDDGDDDDKNQEKPSIITDDLNPNKNVKMSDSSNVTTTEITGKISSTKLSPSLLQPNPQDRVNIDNDISSPVAVEGESQSFDDEVSINNQSLSLEGITNTPSEPIKVKDVKSKASIKRTSFDGTNEKISLPTKTKEVQLQDEDLLASVIEGRKDALNENNVVPQRNSNDNKLPILINETAAVSVGLQPSNNNNSTGFDREKRQQTMAQDLATLAYHAELNRIMEKGKSNNNKTTIQIQKQQIESDMAMVRKYAAEKKLKNEVKQASVMYSNNQSMMTRTNDPRESTTKDGSILRHKAQLSSSKSLSSKLSMRMGTELSAAASSAEILQSNEDDTLWDNFSKNLGLTGAGDENQTKKRNQGNDLGLLLIGKTKTFKAPNKTSSVPSPKDTGVDPSKISILLRKRSLALAVTLVLMQRLSRLISLL